MFDWVYRRIASGIMSNIDLNVVLQRIHEDEELQKNILAFSDQLFERYKQKALGTLGGLQKGMNYAQDDAMPQILDSKGRISLKNMIPWVLQSVISKQGQNKPRL